MRNHLTLRILAGAGSAVLALGLAACGTAPTNGNALRTGQESSLHTSMGETGTPHGHGSTAITPDSRGTARMGATPKSTDGSPNQFGQESTHHTPQGETGTPHTH